MLKLIAVSFLAVGSPSMLKIRGVCSDFHFADQIQYDGYSDVVAVVKLDSCDTGIGLRNRHMKEKYLETAKHPTAVFKGRVSAAEVKGTLTVHGETVPVSGTRSGKQVEFSTKVTGFKMGVPSFAGVTVADEVKVSVELE